MKLYERFADQGFHTSIMTTFGLDFDAYEEIILPRLWGAKCRNNMVLADAGMLVKQLGNVLSLPRLAGRKYNVISVKSHNCFHPKIFFQVGKNGGRIIIGSANLTAPGVSGNLEVVGEIRCGVEDSAEQRLIISALAFLRRHLNSQQIALMNQYDWMLKKTPWLNNSEPSLKVEQLEDNTKIALLTTGGPNGIGKDFVSLIDEPVERLVVFSPYWDADLNALSYLNQELSCEELWLVISPSAKLFPKKALEKFSNVKIYNSEGFKKGRFIHAKIILAETKLADHILYGSANCSLAALGNNNDAGGNEEACIYQKLSPNSVREVLGIQEILSDANIITPSQIDDPIVAPNDSNDNTFADVGEFELKVDILKWYPSPRVDQDGCDVELLDAAGVHIPCSLKRCGDGEVVKYQIADIEVLPMFARIVYSDGRLSTPKIISVIQELKSNLTDNLSRKVKLENESEATRELFDLFEELEKIERDSEARIKNVSLSTVLSRTAVSDSAEYEILNYDDFIVSRHVKNMSKNFSFNSLAGNEITIVRSFLNRLIGLYSPYPDGEVENNDIKEVQYLSFNEDEDFSPSFSIVRTEQLDCDKAREKDLRKEKKLCEDAKNKLVDAYVKFDKRIKNKKEASFLDNSDVLFLRLTLMVLITAAKPPSFGGDEEAGDLEECQILDAVGDDDSWVFLVGRALFSFFGGARPAVSKLRIDSSHDQIPDDIIECWATCFWCMQVCLNCSVSNKEKETINKYFLKLAPKVYCLTLPSKSGLLGEDIVGVMRRLSERYGKRLGLDSLDISSGHSKMALDLFTGDKE